ncbi:MAG: GT4 family glycosyltransferase PelF [Planctomycetota bacterium]|jgi:glycosyltransferase involved in cell wall biosynthesis
MKTADVCLVLEGTYPFVSGGVSSWVHRLTSDLPDHTFRILHISPKRGFYTKGPVYEMPKNILGVQEVHLHDYVLSARGRPTDLRGKVERFRGLVNDMHENKSGAFANFLDALQAERGEGFSSFDLLQTHESWNVLVEAYRREAGDESFLNFFWTWRYAYLPLFNLLSAPIPKARVYHTISTGYAGLLAAGASIQYGRPMILTEHGIYTKERRIEINRCDWIQDWDSGELVAERKPPFFRRFWIRQFEMMSRTTYEYADEIFTLYTGNTLDQISDGADPKKIRVIPNGIDLTRFGEAAQKHDAREPNKRFTVCFLGRVCPIKDVITFISAMRLVADKVPDVHVRILGPMDEDPEYADMCKRQVELLELQNNVFFEGKVNVLEEIPLVDVMVLTSISEAQPLVILEAGMIGIPSIATDVGSCSELLFGRGPEDRSLGSGGFITPMASPGETAKAVLELHAQPELRARMRDSMRARVEKFYDQRDMVAAYGDIYTTYEEKPDRISEGAPPDAPAADPKPEPVVAAVPEGEEPVAPMPTEKYTPPVAVPGAPDDETRSIVMQGDLPLFGDEPQPVVHAEAMPATLEDTASAAPDLEPETASAEHRLGVDERTMDEIANIFVDNEQTATSPGVELDTRTLNKGPVTFPVPEAPAEPFDDPGVTWTQDRIEDETRENFDELAREISEPQHDGDTDGGESDDEQDCSTRTEPGED